MGKLYLKIFSMAMAIVMLLGICTSCKKNNNNNTSATKLNTTIHKTTSPKTSTMTSNSRVTTTAVDGTQQASEPADTDEVNQEEDIDETTEPDSEKIEETFDLGGQTIVVADAQKWIAERSYLDDLHVNRAKEIEEMYNCKVTLTDILTAPTIVGGGYPNFVQAMLAGVYFCDIIIAQSQYAFPSWPANKIVLPLDDYLDFTDPNMRPEIQDATLVNGKHYGLMAYPPSISTNYILYNSAMFESLALPDPYELMKEKKWNWDVFLQCAIQATRDLNGDGFLDQWGVDKMNNNSWIDYLISSNNADYLVNKNGKMEYGLDEPNAFEVLNFINDMFNIYKVVEPVSDVTGVAYINGFAAMCFSNISTYTTFNVPSSTRYVYYPTGPHGNGYSVPVSNVGFYSLPVTIKNPKATAVIANYIFNKMDSTRKDYKDVGLVYLSIHDAKGRFLDDRCRQVFMDTQFLGVNTNTIRYRNVINYVTAQGIFDKIIKTYTPVATIVDGLRPAIEQMITDNDTLYANVKQPN